MAYIPFLVILPVIFMDEPSYIIQVTGFAGWVVLALVVVNGGVEVVNALLHARHTYFPVYPQHFLKKLQIGVLQFDKIAGVPDYTELLQKFQTLVLSRGQVACLVVAERGTFAGSETTHRPNHSPWLKSE